jgi:hypothetical protein
MPIFILIDEFHLTIRAPPGLPDNEYVTMRRTLDDPRFQRALRGAIRAVLRQRSSLDNVRIRLTR